MLVFLEIICKFYNVFLNTILSSQQAINIGNLAFISPNVDNFTTTIMLYNFITLLQSTLESSVCPKDSIAQVAYPEYKVGDNEGFQRNLSPCNDYYSLP